jgi:hypothetical protein
MLDARMSSSDGLTCREWPINGVERLAASPGVHADVNEENSSVISTENPIRPQTIQPESSSSALLAETDRKEPNE